MQAIRSWPDVVPDERLTLGWDAVVWTTENLQQPDGENAGEPWQYTREQLRILLRWYEVHPPEAGDLAGKFVHRRGVLRRMKGWGKDPFLASIAAIELCGPCRFGGWKFHDEDGYLLGIQQSAAWIQVAAVSREQTRNTMTLFPGMFTKHAIQEYGLDIGKEIIYAREGSCRIEAVTSSPRALEGGRPSLVILNESHHWIKANEGKAMADVTRRNLSKSRDGSARSMEITNAHLPDEDSVAEDTYEAWRKADGHLDGVYYDSLEAPNVENLQDQEAVRAALRVARGDSVWLDVDRLAQEIADPTTGEGMARRFYLNQVTKIGGSWLPDGAWETCYVEDVKIGRHKPIVLALDGSYNGDTTALLAATVTAPGKKPIVEVIGCWEAKPEQVDWTVPIADVEDSIRQACKRYTVMEICADPYRWSRSLEQLESEGLPVAVFPQSPQRMTPATQRFYEAIVNGMLRHNGDTRLARHIANARLIEDSRGIRLAKDTKGSTRKIDLAVAALMAFDRALTLQTEDEGERCPVCGGELNARGGCDTCPPAAYSIREMVEEMRKEREAEAPQDQPQQAPLKIQPVVVERHEF